MYGYRLSVCLSVCLQTGLFASDGYAFYVICVSRIRIGLCMVITCLSVRLETGLFASDGYVFYVICVSHIRIGLCMVITIPLYIKIGL